MGMEGSVARVTFIFGYPVFPGRPLGCLVNVLGAGAVKHLPGRGAEVRGELWQGTSPSGSSAVETVPSGSRSRFSWQWKAVS